MKIFDEERNPTDELQKPRSCDKNLRSVVERKRRKWTISVILSSTKTACWGERRSLHSATYVTPDGIFRIAFSFFFDFDFEIPHSASEKIGILRFKFAKAAKQREILDSACVTFCQLGCGFCVGFSHKKSKSSSYLEDRETKTPSSDDNGSLDSQP